MPILMFTERVVERELDSYRELYVEKIGHEPALNIVRNIGMNQTGDAILRKPLPLNSLGHGGQVAAFHAALQGN